MENNNKEQTGFSYTYSAREQAELKKIREKYLPEDASGEDGLARLRRLDRAVTRKATTLALIVGILGVLIMGSGMSLLMTELAAYFGLSHRQALPVGIAVGAVGLLLACLAYPLYQATVSRQRKRIAPEILRLTDELMK